MLPKSWDWAGDALQTWRPKQDRKNCDLLTYLIYYIINNRNIIILYYIKFIVAFTFFFCPSSQSDSDWKTWPWKAELSLFCFVSYLKFVNEISRKMNSSNACSLSDVVLLTIVSTPINLVLSLPTNSYVVWPEQEAWWWQSSPHSTWLWFSSACFLLPSPQWNFYQDFLMVFCGVAALCCSAAIV